MSLRPPAAFRLYPKLALMLSATIACGAGGERTAESGASKSIPLRQLQVRGQFPYTPQQPDTTVLPDSASWVAWVQRTRAQVTSASVDWGKESVVALVTREFSDGPTVVTFERARLNGDTLIVEYQLSFPPQRYDYGSQECAAAAISREYLRGRRVRFQQLPSKGDVPPSVAPAT